MCMSRKPRARGKRIAWLKRYLKNLNDSLARGFLEAWYKNKHYTVEKQEKTVAAKIRKFTKELDVLS